MRQVPGPGSWTPASRHVRRLALLLAVVLSACTVGGDVDPDPSPSASPPTASASDESRLPDRPRVAVVVSPDPPSRATATDAGVRALGRRLPGAELRVVVADDASFLPDIASFLSTEDYDLVCLVGAGAGTAVAEVARSAPSQRFCATPARADGLPTNVLPIDVRTDQAAYVVGRMAQAADPGTAVGLLTDEHVWAPDRLEAALTQGIAEADVGQAGVVHVDALDEEEVVDQVERLVGDGAVTLFTMAGTLDRAVLDAALQVPLPAPDPTGAPTPGSPPDPVPTTEPEFPALVGGPQLRPDGDDVEVAPQVMAVVEVRLEVAVELAVRRLLDGWSAASASVGLAEQAVSVLPTDTPRGRQVQDLVERLVAEVAEGEVPVPAETSS